MSDAAAGHSPKVSGKGRSRDKEARNESPSTTRASDISHVSPWYQHKAWDLGYSECSKPGGAHAAALGPRCLWEGKEP
jgi:hypothetical protein